MTRLTPAADAPHVDYAAIPLPDCDLEAVAAAPRAINEETAAAIDAPDIPEAAIAKPSFAFTARDSPAATDTRADVDSDAGGTCPGGQRHGREQKAKSKTW